MVVERASSSTSVIDVLDHVLDKGIVIDAWVRVSPVGIELLTVEVHVVVASIETYNQHFDPQSLRRGTVAAVAQNGRDCYRGGSGTFGAGVCFGLTCAFA